VFDGEALLVPIKQQRRGVQFEVAMPAIE